MSASGMKYDYGKALTLSILFYDAQRTGRLPANNPIGWRGDSFVDDADGIDLSGGWFDGKLLYCIHIDNAVCKLFVCHCNHAPYV